MATRRDQLHSYQFLTQRVISAFVMRETDPQQSPLRRGVGAIFGGIMIAVLVAAGFGIYGIITKVGTDRWKADGAVVIEKETGASYVYLQGALHPTLNYASALLLAGRGAGGVHRVSTKSLAEVPRGVTVGIPNAPDSLPSLKNRVSMPWTVCAVPGSDNAGRTTRTVLLAVGAQPSGAQALGDQALLVTDAAEGGTFLILRGRRHQIQNADAVVSALFGEATPTPVGTAWLNALPTGAALAPISVEGRGESSPAVPGFNVGDVLVSQIANGTQQYYVVQRDGRTAITQLQQAILAARWPDPPKPVPIAQANDMPESRVRQPAGEEQPPPTTPRLGAAGGSDPICAVTVDAATPPTVSVGGTVAGLDTATPTSRASADGVPLASGVLVPPGKVAVIRVVGAPGGGTGVYYVVTDVGIKYPVPSADVLQSLGYPAVEATEVPHALAARVPTGPALDPAAAANPAASTG